MNVDEEARNSQQEEDHHVSDYFREHNMQPTNSHRDELLETVGALMADLVNEFIDIHPDRKPSVTDETIQSFVVVQTNNLLNSACNICLEDYTQQDRDDKTVRELPCQHKFHFTCIKSWLQHATNCPTCRFELPTDDPMFESFKKRKKEKRQLEADIAELHDSMFS